MSIEGMSALASSAVGVGTAAVVVDVVVGAGKESVAGAVAAGTVMCACGRRGVGGAAILANAAFCVMLRYLQ